MTPDLFNTDSATKTGQEFERWKLSPGFCIFEDEFERIALDRYCPRFQSYGITVSPRLIWELMRDGLPTIRVRFSNRGLKLKKVDGYCMNDHFTTHMARAFMSKHPQFDGLFELRKLGQ